MSRTLVRGQQPGETRGGQAIVEFALVLPILLFMLFAILEGSLLLFVVGSARFGAGEAAREASEAGNAVDADARIVQQVRQSAIGSTSLARVTSIEIYRLIEQPDGTLVKDVSKVNRYQIDGTPLGSIAWPSSARNVTNGSMDFLGITINYRYDWKSGVLLSAGPFISNQAFYIRLEPQSY
jgi:Flp pilus assembly protein TadG